MRTNFVVRLSSRERERLESAAWAAGYEYLGTFLREVGLAIADAQLRPASAQLGGGSELSLGPTGKTSVVKNVSDGLLPKERERR